MTITRDYLLQRRAELERQHDQARRQAEQSRAAALQLSGSIIQIDELLSALGEPERAQSPGSQAEPEREQGDSVAP